MGSVTKISDYQNKKSDREKPVVAADHGGYIALFRDITSKPWYSDIAKKSVFIHCLLKASHTKRTVTFMGCKHNILPGQLVTSLSVLAIDSGISHMFDNETAAKSKLRRILSFFEKEGALCLKTVGAGRERATLVSVKNYTKYQPSTDTQTSTQSDTQTSTQSDTQEPFKNKASKGGGDTQGETQGDTQASTKTNTPYNNDHNNKDLSTNVECSKSHDLEPDKLVKGSKLPNCPHQKILALWAEVMPTKTQPLASAWKSERKGYSHLTARWRFGLTNKNREGNYLYTDVDSGLKWWRGLFEYCAKSDFLMNQFTGFDLDWMVKPDNFRKIIEGKYENRGNEQ